MLWTAPATGIEMGHIPLVLPSAESPLMAKSPSEKFLIRQNDM